MCRAAVGQCVDAPNSWRLHRFIVLLSARRAVAPVVLERDRDLFEALVALGVGGVAVGVWSAAVRSTSSLKIVSSDRGYRCLLRTTLTSTLRTIPMAMMNVHAISPSTKAKTPYATPAPLTTPLT